VGATGIEEEETPTRFGQNDHVQGKTDIKGNFTVSMYESKS
jgi:hypothetical protein